MHITLLDSRCVAKLSEVRRVLERKDSSPRKRFNAGGGAIFAVSSWTPPVRFRLGKERDENAEE